MNPIWNFAKASKFLNKLKWKKDFRMDNKKINWEATTQKNFELLLQKIPIVLRGIAQKKVSQKAEDTVKKENRCVVEEKDLVDAFFTETPFGFHGPLKNDMTEIQINYTQYGHPK